ncbi:MAG: FkbM family methyltransferase [Planctomycetota bacterium]
MLTSLPVVKKLQRTIGKRGDWVRQQLGLAAAPGWNRTREIGVKKWYVDHYGHLRLRFDYPLDANDVVLDLGGYEGEWAAAIHEEYGSTVHVFEPVPSFCSAITERFATNDKVHAHECGLAGTADTISIALSADGSSAWADKSDAVEARLESAATFLEANGIDEVALCKINIEGGEYELLEALLDQGLIGRFRNLQVQFHTFVPDAERRMRAIQDRLALTHALTYSFPFVWENWRRKGSQSLAA